MQKIIGIPQNRERVFLVSIRNDVAQSGFCFPQSVPLKWKLKDFLEDIVDEKYYLSESAIGKLIKKNSEWIKKQDDLYIIKESKNMTTKKSNNIKRIAGIYDGENERHQAGSIYSLDGISPSFTTMAGGGSKQPFILIKEGTKKGYSKANVGDSINISYPSSNAKRGRVGKGVSQTILTSPNIATLEKVDKPICINAKMSIQDRVYDPGGISTSIVASNFRNNIVEKKMFNPYNKKKIIDIAPTQTTTCGITTSSSTILISEDRKYYMRIRKLTPLECWRLMRI